MLISTDAISPDLYKKVRRSVGDFFLVILWRWPNNWLHRPGTDVIVCASEPELIIQSRVILSQHMASLFLGFGGVQQS